MTCQLLAACGRDPNDQMFLFAWGISDAETTDYWKGFFEHLIDDLGLDTSNDLTLMSDQCKGLIGAVNMVLPFAEQRLCARRVYHNWKKSYSGAEFEDLLCGAADAYYMASFNKKMEAVKLLPQDAYDDLKKNAKGGLGPFSLNTQLVFLWKTTWESHSMQPFVLQEQNQWLKCLKR